MQRHPDAGARASLARGVRVMLAAPLIPLPARLF
jgi:hypothetical protein